MKLSKLIVRTGSYASKVTAATDEAVIVAVEQGLTTANWKEFGEVTVFAIEEVP